ncbi:MAG TPA: RHS repeat-associated core domain-containing protein, partial [Anaerolineales bacterium]|nr:RHS repeat-associated core domain-containing protein [Anaerolineales bacterium]
MDTSLSAGLTQALSDGTNTCVYGVGRIAQVNTGTEYFPSTGSGQRLSDALGSVRQLTDASGAITYTRAYDSYGVVTHAYGTSQTSYGYTGEFTSNEMVYLRARHYAPSMGRFLTRDTWEGDVNLPMSFTMWNYVQSNPVNYTDPSGHSWCGYEEYNYANRADFAEKHVARSAFGDYLNTYTAAGIGVQCYGFNFN